MTRPRSWLQNLVFTGLLTVASVVMATAASLAPAAAGEPAGTITIQAQTGTMGPGKLITPTSSPTPFNTSKEQVARLGALMALKSKHAAPRLGRTRP
jgi:hypothetical protein